MNIQNNLPINLIIAIRWTWKFLQQHTSTSSCFENRSLILSKHMFISPKHSSRKQNERNGQMDTAWRCVIWTGPRVCTNTMWLPFCAGYIDAHFCNKVEGADIVLITAVCFQSSYSIITCNIKTRQCSYAMCRFDPEYPCRYMVWSPHINTLFHVKNPQVGQIN